MIEKTKEKQNTQKTKQKQTKNKKKTNKIKQNRKRGVWFKFLLYNLLIL